MKTKRHEISTLQSLAERYVALDSERLELERSTRSIKKQLGEIKEQLQEAVGVAEELEVPYVSSIGAYQISQILKHRDIEAYSYDFVEFKVVKQ